MSGGLNGKASLGMTSIMDNLHCLVLPVGPYVCHGVGEQGLSFP